MKNEMKLDVRQSSSYSLFPLVTVEKGLKIGGEDPSFPLVLVGQLRSLDSGRVLQPPLHQLLQTDRPNYKPQNRNTSRMSEWTN